MQYIQTLMLASLADMLVASMFNDGQIALLRSNVVNDIGDGKANLYYWDATSTATDTSGTTLDTIACTGVTTGRWLLLNGGNTKTITDSTLAVTDLSAEGRKYVVTAAAGCAVTLPAATGSGASLEIVLGASVTSNATTIKVTGDDVMTGVAIVLTDGGSGVIGWETVGTTDTVTFDGSTTGGIKGDRVQLTDIAADLWAVTIIGSATGTEASPFSATVS